MRYSLKRLGKIALVLGVIYALTMPILYFMFRNNLMLNWWEILDGDPRVEPAYRSYILRNSSQFQEIAPRFDIWKVTKALPFQLLMPIMMLLFYMSIMIIQIVGLFWFMSRGRTYVIYPGEYDVTFDDVRGQPEIVSSTKEALSLFQGFKRFKEAGGYPPHGILFEGPPGTGKTLLGKAIAGSARVPFVYASGSSFNNMFMGVGNMRIAFLFRKARRLSQKYGGSVIFIDELDAVGGTRGAVSNTMDPSPPRRGIDKIIMGGLGGNGSAMYVNELLIQMDGMVMPRGLWRHVRRWFHRKPKVPFYNLMVIGATNQASTLDPALLRPGRFDRKLHVGLPTGPGREDIIRYYLDKVPHEEVDIGRLGRATYGFSPAQIKNLVNEALIFALMDGREKLNFTDLWTAKVTEEIGLKEPGLSSARDRQMTAFHEAGHAVVGYVLEVDDQIQIASIIKRGHALGVVYRTPLEERDTELREDMRRDIVVSLAGLAAEEIYFGESTGGPSSDLRGATMRAAQMIGALGMGESLIAWSALEGQSSTSAPIVAILSDPENRKAIGELLADARREALDILRRNEHAVRALAERLLEKGEVQGEEIEALMREKAVARATSAFRPVLELTGATWHPPALLESSRRDEPPGSNGPAAPPFGQQPPPFAPPPAGDKSTAAKPFDAGSFEW